MLKYSVVSRKNPNNQEVKFYAQIATPEPLSIDSLAKMIAQNCTLTRHDIVACLSAFQEQFINALQEGKSIRLGDLGSFRVTMHSIGAETEETFASSNVNRLSIRFAPAPKLRKAISIGADGIQLSKLQKEEPPAPASDVVMPEEEPLAA